ncbi:tryptophan synthase subunit alpha [Rubellicoccus peritrichatus]|uniref:Tryptophan synthase alpha chain n=1 Tax=Rubellicoccus peritrichatus TaxID=3080537 RepID=A0AAQ3LEE8_9BACT|nr:tryptophan synthase subunit alpha [Puniceicoccus sp. CR14]WOO42103.1 tryptophan synthase subunit alpha [Puniceicoccus sp. CR14]
MSTTNRIEKAFANGKEAGTSLFVTYLCAGDPNFDTSLKACKAAIEAGTDILELGVPFSDPLADGLTNQLAAQRALESGMTHEGVLNLVREIRKFSDVPIVFYTYYNLVFAHGEKAYAKMIKDAGVDGILTLDLPPEEAGTFSQACAEVDLKTVFIIAPTTPKSRMELISKATTGFLYYVSRTGVTGERASLADDLKERIEEIRSTSNSPLVVGFGISKPEHVSAVAEVADGVVVGSSIVNCLAANLDNHEAGVTALRDKITTLRSGLARS